MLVISEKRDFKKRTWTKDGRINVRLENLNNENL
jgi:hypothetical protein